MENYSDDYIELMVKQINSRPRKLFDWRSANEYYLSQVFHLNWQFKGLIIYVLNVAGLLVVLTIMQGIVQELKNPDADLLIVLSFVIPIYTALFIIINLFIFRGLSKKADTFLKKLQAIFERVLILLTISMLLATIAGVVSKSLQMTLLTNILLFYMPFVSMMGSLKIKFSN